MYTPEQQEIIDALPEPGTSLMDCIKQLREMGYEIDGTMANGNPRLYVYSDFKEATIKLENKGSKRVCQFHIDIGQKKPTQNTEVFADMLSKYIKSGVVDNEFENEKIGKIKILMLMADPFTGHVSLVGEKYEKIIRDVPIKRPKVQQELIDMIPDKPESLYELYHALMKKFYLKSCYNHWDDEIEFSFRSHNHKYEAYAVEVFVTKKSDHRKEDTFAKMLKNYVLQDKYDKKFEDREIKSIVINLFKIGYDYVWQKTIK